MSNQSGSKFPLKKTLLAFSLTGLLAGVVLTIWIVSTQAEKLIMQVAHFALGDMDSELIDIELGKSQLTDWHIVSANLRVHDSYISLRDLNIQLQLSWPQNFAELKQFSQVSYLSQKITQISIGGIAVELGQSLFLPNRNTMDEQSPAFTLDIKSLPLINIGKTSFILKAQNELPAYHLVMDRLVLNSAGEIISEFSHAGDSIATLKATLETNKWQLASQIELAPLLASLNEISLRQNQNSVLSPLSELNRQWQIRDIELRGQLVSNSSFALASGELISEHRLIEPKLIFNQLAALPLAPKPELAFQITGHLTKLYLNLEPFTLALSPNEAQQQQLMLLLDDSLGNPLSQSTATPVSNPIAKLLSGLKSADTPVGIALTLTEALHYPLSQIQQEQPVRFPPIQLTTLGSKLATQVNLTNANMVKSAETLVFNTDWRLNIKQIASLKLSELWTNPPQDLNWNGSQLTTAGKFSFNQMSDTNGWQLATMPIGDSSQTPLNTGDTLQFTVDELKYNSQDKNTTEHLDIKLNNIAINVRAPLTLSSHPDTYNPSVKNLNTPEVSSKQASASAVNKLILDLPPLALSIEQLYLSQMIQTEIVKTTITGNKTNKDKNTNPISKTDINAQRFLLASQKAMLFEYDAETKTSIDSLLTSPWQNRLQWQADQLNIEKQLTNKGRSRKDTLLKLDKLALAQTLNWNSHYLSSNEYWQISTIELQSQHRLNLASTQKPLTLTGQWVVDTSMTETLALLRQTLPLPTELNVTGHNQLQAQFNLTQKADQLQFAMQLTQSMTELEGFYKDIIFDGGKLQTQCQLTWGQFYKKSSHKSSQDQGYINNLTRLNCPQTMVTFNLFDPGFPLSDIEIEADIALGKDAQKLPDNWLQQLTGLSDTDVSITAKGKVLSGQFLLPEFNLKLHDKSHAYLLLQGISLEDVLRIQPQTGVYADGIFDGILPVDLVDGKVSITGGQLAARAPGGLIAVSGNPAVDQMRQSQPYLDFVFSALEHLQYNQLSSSFDMDQAGDAKLLVEVRGRSQGIERPIHLNYSHEENMLQLFRSLQIGNDLQDRIEKSVK